MKDSRHIKNGLINSFNNDKFKYLHPVKPYTSTQLLYQIISLFLWLFSLQQENESFAIFIWVCTFFLMKYNWSLLFSNISVTTTISYYYNLYDTSSLIYLFITLLLMLSFFINVFKTLYYESSSSSTHSPYNSNSDYSSEYLSETKEDNNGSSGEGTSGGND